VKKGHCARFGTDIEGSGYPSGLKTGNNGQTIKFLLRGTAPRRWQQTTERQRTILTIWLAPGENPSRIEQKILRPFTRRIFLADYTPNRRDSCVTWRLIVLSQFGLLRESVANLLN